MAGTEKNNLREQVAMLPLSPGVYQFVDRSGTIIYVGKAKSLRKRVSSYFVQSKEHSPKVRVLVKQIAEIRHIVVDSETDALLLENSLIKTLQPRYNILLKDDKTYPYLQTQSRSRADRQGKIYGLPAIPPGQLQRPLHRGAGRRGIRPARRHGRRGAQGRPAPRA